MELKTTDEPVITEEPAAAHGSRREAIGALLDRLEKQLLAAAEVKCTVADYLRLLQLMKEMGDERPREIEITWVNSLREERDR